MLKRAETPFDDDILPLQQHPNFARALRYLGRDAQVDIFEDIAQALVIRRGPLRFASRGPIWARNADETGKVAILRAAKLHIVNAEGKDDADSLRRAGFLCAVTGASVAELPILSDTCAQLDQANGKWRNMYRKAKRSPLRIAQKQFCPVKHAWLLEADTRQQRSKGFRALPAAVTLAFSHVAPQDCQIFTALHRKQPVAAMLFLRHGPVATYQIGWADADGRHFAAHQLLLMQAAGAFARMGVTRLDLGTVDTETAPGLARFKISTGANVRMLGGSWIKLPLL